MRLQNGLFVLGLAMLIATGTVRLVLAGAMVTLLLALAIWAAATVLLAGGLMLATRYATRPPVSNSAPPVLLRIDRATTPPVGESTPRAA